MVVKNGSRLCGTGAARSSTPILQNKAYWEFKLQQAGVWSCGLANPGCDLNKNLGNDLNSWALTHENVIKANGNIEHKLETKIQEGDIIVSTKESYLIFMHLGYSHFVKAKSQGDLTFFSCYLGFALSS